MESKKQWETPQLIVLGKGTPEENVLKHCKNVAQYGPNIRNLPGCRGGGQGRGACSGLGQS